ncbi:MAG: methyltransferase domain-containing protein [Gemmatimonadetes bacterium]|nr:methyltransferase domain-containing protein [Gemmatimonadota bacterium]
MTSRPVLPKRALDALIGGAGILAGAQALLWMRVLGGASQQRPEVTLHTWALVLLAAAAGACLTWTTCTRPGHGALRSASLYAAASAALLYAGMPIGAAVMRHGVGGGRLMLFVAAALSAAALGALFTALLIAATTGAQMLPGARVSAVHLLGAAVGVPALGYWLLDSESLAHAILIVTLAGLGLAQALWLSAPDRRRRTGVTAFSLAALFALVAQGRLYDGFLERVHFGPQANERRYAALVERRDGAVGVTADGEAYADGLYLGAYSLDVRRNTNLISRAYFVPALHRSPRRVLQLGLGTGAWSRVLADLRSVDSLTIVEPNPALIDALWRYPAIAGVLDDPRVKLHVGDPRLWLRRHPDARYDVIVSNGPWHWRAGATHQLSAEYLQLLKGRLDAGGVVYFNASGSLDALYTAAGVWRHVMRVATSVAASDAPFDQSREERRAALLSVVDSSGGPRIAGPQAAQTLEAMLDQASGDLAPALRRANDLWNITDDNLAPEFKAAGAGAWWRTLPARVWRPDRAWPTVLF